ncbi:hypothetical protein [Alistipes sp.]|uniref:hypothetical protein n=1 Tax=Alistipes sp. TaxID=1872444 RepID=UPI0025C34A66|nr:hypothetical protein [Alistipes sp.]
MAHPLRKTGYSGLLLLILLATIIGHKVHIYTENPLHFAALCGDLVPDNGAQSQVVEKCIVDDYDFFPCLRTETSVLEVRLTPLGTRAPLPICAKLAVSLPHRSLRAPPAAV